MNKKNYFTTLRNDCHEFYHQETALNCYHKNLEELQENFLNTKISSICDKLENDYKIYNFAFAKLDFGYKMVMIVSDKEKIKSEEFSEETDQNSANLSIPSNTSTRQSSLSNISSRSNEEYLISINFDLKSDNTFQLSKEAKKYKGKLKRQMSNLLERNDSQIENTLLDMFQEGVESGTSSRRASQIALPAEGSIADAEDMTDDVIAEMASEETVRGTESGPESEHEDDDDASMINLGQALNEAEEAAVRDKPAEKEDTNALVELKFEQNLEIHVIDTIKKPKKIVSTGTMILVLTESGQVHFLRLDNLQEMIPYKLLNDIKNLDSDEEDQIENEKIKFVNIFSNKFIIIFETSKNFYYCFDNSFAIFCTNYIQIKNLSQQYFDKQEDTNPDIPSFNLYSNMLKIYQQMIVSDTISPRKFSKSYNEYIHSITFNQLTAVILYSKAGKSDRLYINFPPPKKAADKKKCGSGEHDIKEGDKILVDWNPAERKISNMTSDYETILFDPSFKKMLPSLAGASSPINEYLHTKGHDHKLSNFTVATELISKDKVARVITFNSEMNLVGILFEETGEFDLIDNKNLTKQQDAQVSDRTSEDLKDPSKLNFSFNFSVVKKSREPIPPAGRVLSCVYINPDMETFSDFSKTNSEGYTLFTTSRGLSIVPEKNNCIIDTLDFKIGRIASAKIFVINQSNYLIATNKQNFLVQYIGKDKKFMKFALDENMPLIKQFHQIGKISVILGKDMSDKNVDSNEDSEETKVVRETDILGYNLVSKLTGNDSTDKPKENPFVTLEGTNGTIYTAAVAIADNENSSHGRVPGWIKNDEGPCYYTWGDVIRTAQKFEKIKGAIQAKDDKSPIFSQGHGRQKNDNTVYWSCVVYATDLYDEDDHGEDIFPRFGKANRRGEYWYEKDGEEIYVTRDSLELRCAYIDSTAEIEETADETIIKKVTEFTDLMDAIEKYELEVKDTDNIEQQTKEEQLLIFYKKLFKRFYLEDDITSEIENQKIKIFKYLVNSEKYNRVFENDKYILTIFNLCLSWRQFIVGQYLLSNYGKNIKLDISHFQAILAEPFMLCEKTTIDTSNNCHPEYLDLIFKSNEYKLKTAINSCTNKEAGFKNQRPANEHFIGNYTNNGNFQIRLKLFLKMLSIFSLDGDELVNLFLICINKYVNMTEIYRLNYPQIKKQNSKDFKRFTEKDATKDASKDDDPNFKAPLPVSKSREVSDIKIPEKIYWSKEKEAHKNCQILYNNYIVSKFPFLALQAMINFRLEEILSNSTAVDLDIFVHFLSTSTIFTEILCNQINEQLKLTFHNSKPFQRSLARIFTIKQLKQEKTGTLFGLKSILKSKGSPFHVKLDFFDCIHPSSGNLDNSRANIDKLILDSGLIDKNFFAKTLFEYSEELVSQLKYKTVRPFFAGLNVNSMKEVTQEIKCGFENEDYLELECLLKRMKAFQLLQKEDLSEIKFESKDLNGCRFKYYYKATSAWHMKDSFSSDMADAKGFVQIFDSNEHYFNKDTEIYDDLINDLKWSKIQPAISRINIKNQTSIKTNKEPTIPFFPAPFSRSTTSDLSGETNFGIYSTHLKNNKVHINDRDEKLNFTNFKIGTAYRCLLSMAIRIKATNFDLKYETTSTYNWIYKSLAEHYLNGPEYSTDNSNTSLQKSFSMKKDRGDSLRSDGEDLSSTSSSDDEWTDSIIYNDLNRYFRNKKPRPPKLTDNTHLIHIYDILAYIHSAHYQRDGALRSLSQVSNTEHNNPLILTESPKRNFFQQSVSVTGNISRESSMDISNFPTMEHARRGDILTINATDKQLFGLNIKKRTGDKIFRNMKDLLQMPFCVLGQLMNTNYDHSVLFKMLPRKQKLLLLVNKLRPGGYYCRHTESGSNYYDYDYMTTGISVKLDRYNFFKGGHFL